MTSGYDVGNATPLRTATVVIPGRIAMHVLRARLNKKTEGQDATNEEGTGDECEIAACSGRVWITRPIRFIRPHVRNQRMDARLPIETLLLERDSNNVISRRAPL